MTAAPRGDTARDRNPIRHSVDERSSGAAGLLPAVNRWLATAIATLLCLSGLQFCLYITVRYLAPLLGADPDQDDLFAPGFSNAGDPEATAALVLHLVTGVLVMLLGCVQFITPMRRRWPVIHRMTGRVYVCAAMLTALGGLGYIVLNGTVGGAIMNIGFGLYGALVLLASAQCLRYARARNFPRHREWDVRLFVLVIASWLYRLEYGISAVFETGGHTPQFTGWFDHMMAFAFYLPNLVVAEMYLRALRPGGSVALRVAALTALSVAAAVTVAGVYSQW